MYFFVEQLHYVLLSYAHKIFARDFCRLNKLCNVLMKYFFFLWQNFGMHFNNSLYSKWQKFQHLRNYVAKSININKS